MNGLTPGVVMLGLCLLSAFFWWQESRRKDTVLSLRGRIHRRLTILFGVLAIAQYYFWS